MEDSRRTVILDELDRWRADGLLDEDEYRFMRSRYDQGRDITLDRPAAATALARGAGYASHLVGGLLLGAALVALTLYFVPLGAWQPMTAIAIAILCASAAYVAEARRGELVAEAGFAAALVAAASVPFYLYAMPILGVLAALLAVGVTLLRRGRTPLAPLAAVTYFVGAMQATRVDLISASASAGAADSAFLLAILGYGALLVPYRAQRWGSLALAAQGIAVALATFPVLDSIGLTDPGLAALALGAVLGALFLVGLKLEARPLVATTSAMLTLAAISFAFLALGPALAAIVLLLLGALLVWQAEVLRGYFAPKKAAPGGLVPQS